MSVREISIVLVEDSMTTRLFYRHAIEKAGFKVIEAEDGNTALEVINKEYPDIVILDMMLPDISGLQILKQIRNEPLTKNIPVLALTAVREIKQVQEVLQAGANHYCVKGNITPEKLIEMIYKLLKRSHPADPS